MTLNYLYWNSATNFNIAKPTLSRRAFWDVDLKQLDFDRYPEFTLVRAMERGTSNDIREVIRCYGSDKVRFILTNAERLLPRAQVISRRLSIFTIVITNALRNTTSEELFNVLSRLMSLPELSDFRLVGGTALSLLRGHRESPSLSIKNYSKFPLSNQSIPETYSSRDQLHLIPQ
ncbi:DUF6922 domain-containing protein [Chitinophaga pinensis]|uniref:DUF6922 domain-containing protein n=1 Tax=Chitinophaga pinensis (strain ATCC 43595 / DSM 2588 / LMG 13176 / NBRC 15968 / NCIMB 11800 / UQM 2034) TaxID=485918 RepID=A0A979GSN0_CHIPD|nr:hypothetical protein Cpin_0587 [Chitinophaga pinensis DSM 2588]